MKQRLDRDTIAMRAAKELKDGDCVGYVTSGGYAHHVQKSVAMGYVSTENAVPGTQLQVEILGQTYDAMVQGAPLYDANGANMRA